MTPPKQLPWYARKAGVPQERAEALWRKALRIAAEKTGWIGTSEYWSAAMNRFLCLLDQEQATLCSPRVAPLVQSQIRVWRLPLLAIEDIFQVVTARWRRNSGYGRKAA
jgi:hypothetical protein